ncbi:MAG TPA: hypothetical protein VF162_18105 [Streptosporangiaceae bacterium]
MRPRDLPSDGSPDRSLADGRAAPAEPADRARPPAELLDNLRLRLRQLADNHPSAWRDDDALRDHGRPGGEPPGEPSADAGLADGAFDEIADETGAENTPGDAADAQAPREGSLADLIRAIKGAGGTLSGHADAGLLGTMDLTAGGRSGDPYRPWFMSGESSTPWFAAGDEP